MIARLIKPEIHALIAIDWDRRLFDELVPLPEGTTYNSYLVRGTNKTVLIDTAYPPFTQDLLAALRNAGVKRLDYIVSNHAEQDHSGSIPALLAAYPEAIVVTNARARDLIAETLLVPADRFHEVKDGDTLSLGGKTLHFHAMPWVHWPDTMVTHIPEDRILFPCDFFGSHLATSDLFATDEPRVEDAAKRYYAEIMMPFRVHIQKYLTKLGQMPIEMIAPSHGPIHNRPEFILDLYRDWAGDEARPQVVIPCVSMYESTNRMVSYLVDRLLERGISVQPFNMVDTDTGDFAKALVDASTVIFASPAVLSGPHPSIVNAAYLMNALKPKTKVCSVIGSYGWGGTIVSKSIRDLLPQMLKHMTFLDPVLIKGLPKDADYAALDRLVDAVEAAHTEEEAVA